MQTKLKPLGFMSLCGFCQCNRVSAQSLAGGAVTHRSVEWWPRPWPRRRSRPPSRTCRASSCVHRASHGPETQRSTRTRWEPYRQSCKDIMAYTSLYELTASLLQSAVSHDLQKSFYAARKTFMIISNVENSCAPQYFCGNCDTFYFSGFFNE